MTTIRNEIRRNDQGEPEAWINFRDLIDWLDTLPSYANVPAAAGVSQEIKRLLVEQFAEALDKYEGE